MKVEIVNVSAYLKEPVRQICKQTGFMGSNVEYIFSNGEVFADFFTKYYLDYEPENCFAALVDGEVAGYLIASLHPLKYVLLGIFFTNIKLLFRLIIDFSKGKLTKNDINFLKWFFLKGFRETPRTPFMAAHFHMNIVTKYRNGSVSLRLLNTLMAKAEENSVRKIAFQTQVYDDRRDVRIFERFGFRLFNSRKTTKFDKVLDKNVYIATFVKELV
ncbi:MAG: hypothetical protein FXF49_07195 [Flexistipes sinusarabici]|uniref:N-acetyltransferase domain-containing protein n=1 Tax=Flexistipes sinusarabici TaxID=2352 RepID=A0A5D0MMU5_FLESI|nr:hypothetical protein [Flexistipes sinusarabici]TYB33265.1 MAG: hypothetical protein FXF49_07195 [Flexistipes sinusarabici]